MDLAKDYFYGGIYSEDYEEFSDGGPKCYEDMEFSFRLLIATLSIVLNLIIIKFTIKSVLNSQELDIERPQNLHPNALEYLIGVLSFLTYTIQFGFKLYTRRGIFMNNPCHVVLLVQAYLLVTKKNRFSAILFIIILRWSYGTYSAMMFPVINGLNLTYEVELFWVEHYLGALIQPIALIVFGRYGYFEIRNILTQQFFGFCVHILYQRIYMLPLSLLTFANLNFTLCKPECDPFLPLIGNWYYLFAEGYLNLLSFMTVTIIIILSSTIKLQLKLFQSFAKNLKILIK